ncbi:hemerythrin domain-containing protein [Solihabitans fulvus]|nr:hemerythrin domain-containing protein [Solihabitans fulvus]
MHIERPSELDLAKFLLAHQGFRRQAARLRDLLASPEELTGERLAALTRHWTKYLCVLEHHHTTEDEKIWPLLRAAAPEAAAALDELEAEHAELDRLIDASAAALVRLADDPYHRPAAAALFGEFADLVDRHLDHEEKHAVPLLLTALTRDEWLAIETANAASLRAHDLVPFVLPWSLEDAPPAVVDAFLSSSPPELRTVYEKVWLPAYQRQARLLWQGMFDTAARA